MVVAAIITAVAALTVPFIPPVARGINHRVNGCGETRILITYPKNGARVATPVQLKGNECLPERSEVWVLVSGPDQLYHPQRLLALLLPGNRWTAPAYPGLSADRGMKFVLSACLANSVGQKLLHKYVIKASRNGDWYGLSGPPKGCAIMDSIEVTRR